MNSGLPTVYVVHKGNKIYIYLRTNLAILVFHWISLWTDQEDWVWFIKDTGGPR